MYTFSITAWKKDFFFPFSVFPYEYQRALKELEQEIEELEANIVEEIPEKNGQNGQNGQNGENCSSNLADIEDSITDVNMKKKKMEVLDKTRGFVKYDREKRLYQDAKNRQLGWEEIYDFKTVRKGMLYTFLVSSLHFLNFKD